MLLAAMQALGPRQALNHVTRAVHAAAFWTARRGIWSRCARMSAGTTRSTSSRARSPGRGSPRRTALVLLTSRVSVELVQKAATMGAPVIVAVSAPTALAIRTAEAAGITLVGIARADGFEVFTHAQRIAREAADATVA